MPPSPVQQVFRRFEASYRSGYGKRLARKHAGAFTMVELLVTIGVITLLAALLIPGISSIRNSANTIRCQSNLRQIFSATQYYLNDHDGALPGPLRGGQPAIYHSADKASQDNYLATFLAPYLNWPQPAGWNAAPAKVFLCPAWQAWSKNANPAEAIRIYMVSQNSVTLAGGAQASPFGYPGVSDPVKLGLINSPSRVPMMYDLDQQDAPAYAGDANAPSKAIHTGKHNVLFFDGHVETLQDIPPNP